MPDNNDQLERPEEDIGKQIDAFLGQGYSFRQLKKAGYASSTIRQRMRKRAKEKGMPPPENANKGGNHPIALTVKEKETVLPEWLEQQVGELYDGDEKMSRVFMAGMSIPLLGLRLFSESMKPFGDLMKLWQAGQAEAAGGVKEAAREAGEEVAGQTLAYLQSQDKSKTEAAIASSPQPFQAMMVRMMEPMFGNMFRSMFPAMFPQQGQPGQPETGLPPGWEFFKSEG